MALIDELQAEADENGFCCIDGNSSVWRAIVLQLIYDASQGGGPGGVSSPQIYTGAFDDPNGNVTPDDPALGALYYKDHPTEVNWWRWSVDDQVWYASGLP